jgi:hypothetical protein
MTAQNKNKIEEVEIGFDAFYKLTHELPFDKSKILFMLDMAKV